MTNGHINRVIRGNKRKPRESADAVADRVLKIGRDMLRRGQTPTWENLSEAVGYNASSGGGGISVAVKKLKQRGQWPITLPAHVPYEPPAVFVCKSPGYHDASGDIPPPAPPAPPAADELETLREIRVRLDGLSTAARALVRSWL
jgi:hypothetical protein